MTTDVVPSKPCALDEDGCVSLLKILQAFNAPITEEHAWALCYQCAKTCQQTADNDRGKCVLVSELEHVLLSREGYVHRRTIAPNEPQGRSSLTSETKLIFCLGSIIWRALDFGLNDYEEKHLSAELETLIDIMTASDEQPNTHHETDDEGIERDAGDDDQQSGHTASLDLVIRLCTDRLGKRTGLQADTHYRAVVRALVAEALELSSFLEKVSQGTNDLKSKTEATSAELDKLQFSDWARLWVQVISELRNGVKLKKVNYSRTPIEFELTPYEILMDDIRSRRYKLNKVMVDGDIPHRVKKDAHAIILEFIRSRPPLKKASDRKLRPAVSRPSTPRELLMDSIKKGRILRPSRSPYKISNKRVIPVEEAMGGPNNTDLKNPSQTRRLIQVDFSILQSDDEDDEAVSRNSPTGAGKNDNGPFIRTGTATISQDVYQEYVDQALEPYDLATQCPSRRSSTRRHTIVVCGDGERTALSATHSRPSSRQSHVSPTTEAEIQQLGTTPPERSWSRTSLQDDIFQTKTWAQECLSLTLEEIVHIRSVLTKAELEALPVDGHVKEDVEKRKVCFLCLKTRFGIFGPWSQRCRLCKRNICAKCYSKMRIPTEHFAHVPVVALSPSLLNSPQDDDESLASRLSTSASGVGAAASPVNSVGSAPSSPHLTRSAPGSRLGHHGAPLSLPPASPASTISERRTRLSRSRTMGRADKKSETLKGIEMIVCHDCKAMVIQIIKSSRTSRNNAIRNLTLNLSPVY